MSRSGKSLENKKASVDFPGKAFIPKTMKDVVGAVGKIGGRGAQAGLSMSMVTLWTSSFFTSSLSCLSKFIQVIDFTGLISMLNFGFDPLLGSLLEQLSKFTEINFISFPLNDLVSNVENSIASQWKGKLSAGGTSPYYLQNMGYSGVVMWVSKNNLSLQYQANDYLLSYCFIFQTKKFLGHLSNSGLFYLVESQDTSQGCLLQNGHIQISPYRLPGNLPADPRTLSNIKFKERSRNR